MINNVHFSERSEDVRTGSEKDEKNLTALFTCLRYDVESYCDLGLEVDTLCLLLHANYSLCLTFLSLWVFCMLVFISFGTQLFLHSFVIKYGASL